MSASENQTAALTTDYDFTTSAKPEEIQLLFPEHFYENTFGTVSVTHEHLTQQMGRTVDLSEVIHQELESDRIIDVAQATKIHISLAHKSTSRQVTGGQGEMPPDAREASSSDLFPAYQITTFRSDEVYDDFRRPTSMNWGTTLDQDLERRDFTINAMALKVDLNLLLEVVTPEAKPLITLNLDHYTVIDPHQGQVDLQARLIKTVGTPTVRFQEDALRMARAIRFSVQLNLHIDEPTFTAITAHAHLISHISWERIRDEFLKMLKSPYPAEAIELLDEAGLLTHIMPELLATKGVEQGGHHTTDVWTHSLDALRTTPATDPIVRLATLLHDIAKPQTQAFQNQTITFYNHEIVGARIAKKIAERLRLSRTECERIFILVRHHMFHYQPENTDAAIRRFMRKVGLENIDDILDLREGDRLGSGARKTSWRLEEMKQRMIEQLHQPFAVTDLAINGHDLMTEFKLKPGPMIGQVLNELFEKVMDQPELNTKETLLDLAEDMIAPTRIQTTPL